MKIGSIACLVLGLVFFGVASSLSTGEGQGATMTEEQLTAQTEANRVIHGANIPGAEVDTKAVEAARAKQDQVIQEHERQISARKRTKLILQGIGGISLLAGIILYVLDKRNE